MIYIVVVAGWGELIGTAREAQFMVHVLTASSMYPSIREVGCKEGRIEYEARYEDS
jgi:hypothetical protein